MHKIDENDRVLFVDDEELILQTIHRGLINESFTCLFAHDGEEALEMLEKNEIAVLVTDLKMPRMNGLELINIVQEKYPNITRIILTAYYQVSNILSAVNKGHIYRYLTKPWETETDFIPTIRQAIEDHNIRVDRQRLLRQLKEQNEHLKQQYDEICRLKEVAETSDANKTKILNHITTNFIPYLTDVVINTDQLKQARSTEWQQIGKDLNKRGMEILRLLRKLEVLLQGKG